MGKAIPWVSFVLFFPVWAALPKHVREHFEKKGKTPLSSRFLKWVKRRKDQPLQLGTWLVGLVLGVLLPVV